MLILNYGHKTCFSQKFFYNFIFGHLFLSIFQITKKLLPILLCFFDVTENMIHCYYFCNIYIYDNKNIIFTLLFNLSVKTEYKIILMLLFGYFYKHRSFVFVIQYYVFEILDYFLQHLILCYVIHYSVYVYFDGQYFDMKIVT